MISFASWSLAQAYNVLASDVFIEKNGLELKGQYTGQTAPTVRQMFLDAKGGTLFIDEAYALVDNGGDQFSGEAIRMLLTEAVKYKGEVLVIMAGYKVRHRCD